MRSLRERVWQVRERFCFDTHVPALVGFFRQVIAQAGLADRRPA